MGQAGIGQKISWFLYQKGLGTAKPEFLLMAKFGDPDWFQVADTLIKDRNLEARNLILDQLLRAQNFRNHPKRPQFLRILGVFLVKGIIDERRRIIKYVDENIKLFSTKDEAIYGPLITAQRDSDIITANTAESIVNKLRGDGPETPQEGRKGYLP